MLSQATALITIGQKVENERKYLKRMIDNGAPFSSTEVIEVVKRFNEADSKWRLLEEEHRALKAKLKKRN